VLTADVGDAARLGKSMTMPSVVPSIRAARQVDDDAERGAVDGGKE